MRAMQSMKAALVSEPSLQGKSRQHSDRQNELMHDQSMHLRVALFVVHCLCTGCCVQLSIATVMILYRSAYCCTHAQVISPQSSSDRANSRLDSMLICSALAADGLSCPATGSQNVTWGHAIFVRMQSGKLQQGSAQCLLQGLPC